MALKKLTPQHAMHLAIHMPPAPTPWPKGVKVPIVKGEPIYAPEYGYINPNNTGVAAMQFAHRQKQWDAFETSELGNNDGNSASRRREFQRQMDLGIAPKITDSTDAVAAQVSDADHELQRQRESGYRDFVSGWRAEHPDYV